MNDERLRQLYGRGVMARDARDARSELADACAIDPDRLLALVRHELPEDEQLALLDQVMASRACREAFELLRVVEAAGRAAGGAPSSAGDALPPRVSAAVHEPPAAAIGDADGATRRPASHPPSAPDASVATFRLTSSTPPVAGPPIAPPDAVRPAAWWRRGTTATMALAACALLAVGLVARDRVSPGGEATRGSGSGVTLIAPATDPATGAAAAGFVWHAVPGASRYEFELLGADGEPVHQATTSDTVLTLPAAVIQELEPGTEYRWLVRATTASGGQSSSSARPLRIPIR